MLTGSQHWIGAASPLGLTAHLVGEDVTKAYGITPEGAVLVRPDFVIAWRAHGPQGDLARVLDRILSRV